MEGKKKNGRYEVVFSGTGAEGERRIEIMGNVMRVLKLDEQRAISLFERDDERAIYRTDDRTRSTRSVRPARNRPRTRPWPHASLGQKSSWKDRSRH